MTIGAVPRPPACFHLVVLWLLAWGAIGCGGPPEANVQLTNARTAYAAAANDGEIRTLAGGALVEARESLERAERAWRERRDVGAVEHHAYVTQQRLRLAEERVVLATVERSIGKVRTERQRVLRDLRTAKAKAATSASRAPEEPDEVESPAAPAPTPAAGPSQSVLGAVMTRRGLVLTLHDKAFTEDGVALRPEAAPTLEALVDFLVEYPERRVRVEGFAGAMGARAEALAFSQRRADAVAAALVDRGVAASRVAAVGLGAAYPVASNEDATGQRQNRRVEIVISDPRGVIPARE